MQALTLVSASIIIALGTVYGLIRFAVFAAGF